MLARTNRIQLVAFLLLVSLASAAFTGQALADTNIDGNQSGLWDLAGSPYVVSSNVTVPFGETLVVQAGVEVVFPSNGYFRVNGTLDVQGTEVAPVLLTSSLTSPVAGSWQGVIAGPNSFLDLDHLWIRYGGAQNQACLGTAGTPATLVDWNGGGLSDSSSEGIDLLVGQASLQNLLIERCADSGIELHSLAPPVLDSIEVNDSGLTAVVIEANPGNIPSTITGTGNGNNGTYVTGTVGGSEPAQTWTWSASPGFPVIAHQVSVNTGDVLEVTEGSVVKFFETTSQITVNGGGAVLRTPGPGSVHFTSLRDDTVGGDTNNDGSASSPSAGDWNGVYLNNYATADLVETSFAYGGSGGYGNLATTSGTMASLAWHGGGSRSSAERGASFFTSGANLSGLSFDTNASDGFYVFSVTPPVLDEIDASNNGDRAMAIVANLGHIPGTLSGTGNGTNGIYVTGTVGGSEPGQTWTWTANPGFPVIADQVYVNTGDTLELGEGSVVKFSETTSQITVNGGGAVLRTPGPGPVHFTSLRDDTVGGDTNNDGSASSPSAGDWNGVYLNNYATADWVETSFAYGGSGGYGNLATTSGTMASLAWHGGGSRLSAERGASFFTSGANLSGLSIESNASEGLYLFSVTPPDLDEIDASNNGGRAILIATNPGHIPGTLSGTGNGTNGIHVTGTVGGSEPGQTWTWTANPGFPVIADQVYVNTGDTLELGEGSVVKFSGTTSQIAVNGGGAVLRTPGPGPVHFTSLRDDTVGGDTNNDGSASSPSAGDWNGVYFNNSGAADLIETTFTYGGSGGYGNVATTSGTMASLAWHGGGSRSSAERGASVLANGATLSGLSFDGNVGDGLYLYPFTPPVLDEIDASNNGGRAIAIALNPGHIPGTLSGTGNGTNGIYVAGTVGGGADPQAWQWESNPGFPTVVDVLNVPTGSELVLADGAVIKFWNTNSGISLQSSLLRTASEARSGEVPQPVWFTSLKDDSRGGDTNGDGDATVPAPGDWSTIYLNNSSSADLADTWFAFGGASGNGNIGVSSGTASTLNWNRGGSLRSSSNGLSALVTNLEVTEVRFADNLGDGASVRAFGANPAMNSCDFVDNGGHGLRNQATSPTIEALDSWWGDASGPFDPTDGDPDFNPGGLGQPVSDWVLYREWALGPNTNVTPDDFALLSPENGNSQDYSGPVEILFTWESTVDADGDVVTYDLEINSDAAFGAETMIAEYVGLTEPSGSHLFGAGGDYFWRAIARDGLGGATVASPGYHSLQLIGDTSDVPTEPGAESAMAFGMGRATPNPFASSTTMSFSLDVDQDVSLEIFDTTGRLVRSLHRGRMSAGSHLVDWNREDDQRRSVPNGLYFYRLAGEREVAVGRIVAIR